MRILCTFLLLFLCADMYGQNRTITGTVIDQNSAPVPNATVLAKGTKLGVATNASGEFSLSVPSSVTTLIVSSVNFTTQEADITSSNSVTIKLQPSSSNLSE